MHIRASEFMTLLSSISLQVSRAKKCSFMCNFSKKRKMYVYWSHSLFISDVKHLCSLSLGVWKWNKNPFWDFFLLLFALILGWCKKKIFFSYKLGKVCQNIFFLWHLLYEECLSFFFFFLFFLPKEYFEKKGKKNVSQRKNLLRSIAFLQLAIFRKGLVGWGVEKKDIVRRGGKFKKLSLNFA